MTLKFKNLFLLFVTVIFVSYFFSLFLLEETFVADLIYLFAPLTAVVLGFFSLKVFGIKNNQGHSLLFLSLGMLCFFIGEFFWFHFQYIQNIDPDYSFADVFFLLSYPLSFIGIFIKLKTSFLSLKDLKSILTDKKSYLFSIFLVITTMIVCYFGIFKAYDSEVGFVENAVFIFYGVGDLIVIFACSLIVLLIKEFRGGKFSFAWLMFVASYFLTLLGDIFYAIYRGSIYEENLILKFAIDGLWMLGYFVFAFAMLILVLIIKEKQEKVGIGTGAK